MLFRDTVLDKHDDDVRSAFLEHQDTVETLVEHVIRQWIMPLRGLDRESDEDKWLNDAIVKFLKIHNTDNVSTHTPANCGRTFRVFQYE